MQTAAVATTAVRGLSLTQPWATACALGSKRIETRSWSTRYRGPVAIHASKRYGVYELIHQQCCWNWNGALWPTGFRMGSKANLDEVLPFGAIVGVVNLVDCRPTESFTVGELDVPRSPDCERSSLYQWTERQLGDYSPGRFGFVLENPRLLREPLPCKGALSLWGVPPDVYGQLAEIL